MPFLTIAPGCVMRGDFSISLRPTRNDGVRSAVSVIWCLSSDCLIVWYLLLSTNLSSSQQKTAPKGRSPRKNSWIVPCWCTVGLRVIFFNESARGKPMERNIYLVKEGRWSIIATRISSRYSSGVSVLFSVHRRDGSHVMASIPLSPFPCNARVRGMKECPPGLSGSLPV